MPTTVVNKKTGETKTIPKRISLRDRQRIKEINRARVEAGLEELKGTESVRAEVMAEQAAAETSALKQAQKTVRELNESAQRSGSGTRYQIVDRGGQVQIVKQEVQRVRVQQSVAVGQGGPQQLPPLQTQVTPSQRVEDRFLPVGSSREGGQVFLDTESGKTVTEVGTSQEGGTIFLEQSQPVQREVVPFGREPSSRPGSGFGTSLGFVNTEARKNLQKFGTFLYEGGEKIKEETKQAPIPFKVAGQVTGYSSQVVGGVVERFGYDPQLFTFKEVIIPSAGGAAAGAVFAAGSKAAPKAIEAVAATSSIKAVQSLAGRGQVITDVGVKTLGVAGVVAAAGVVATRESYEQSPDILFGFLGGAAGAKGTGNVDKIEALVPKTQAVYGGSPVPNRAARLNLPTAGKPTSKAQIRKQSFNQQYNPNLYRQGTEFGVKTGKEREFIRLLERGSAEVGKRRPASEFGVKGQSVEAGFKVTKGQAPQEFQRFTFTPEGKPYKLPTSPGAGKAFKESSREDVGFLVAAQKTKAYVALQTLSGPKRVPVKPAERFVDNPAVLRQIPEFELRPNAPSKGFSQFAQTERIAGAQPGRGRVYENILARARAKQVSQTSGLASETPVGPVGASPVRDIALSSRFSGVPSVVSTPGVTSISSAGATPRGVDRVVFPEVKVSTISRPIQESSTGVKAFVVAPQDREVKTEQKVTTFVVAGPKLRQEQPVNIDSAVFVPPQVKQVPIAAERSVVEQRTRQRSESVVSTGFDFRGAPAPTLEFETPTFPTVPAPRVSERPRTTPKTKTRPFTPEIPPTPPRFGFPEKARSAAKFEVQVGARGNKYFFDLGVGGPEVLNKARDLVKGTAAATVRVKTFGRSEKDLSGFFGSEFTQTKPGVFVQKTEKRISSRGEKEQIPGASKSARLSKGTAFGDALRKLNEGFSLRGIRRGQK